MADFKLKADTAIARVIDKNATLANGLRAAGDYDNSTALDPLCDVFLYLTYDTTAPSVGDVVAEIYLLYGDSETPEVFPVGGDGSGSIGKDVDPQASTSISTLEARNPSTSTGTITGASQADPVDITDVAHGAADGDHVYISGVVGMTEINDRFFEIDTTDTDSFDLVGEDGTGHTAYTSGGTWWEVDVLQLKDVPLGPGGNRFVVKNLSGQTFSAEWELKIKPKKQQTV